jgi:membrane protein
MKTHAWRAWDHYGDVRGDRLAAAVTYAGFLAIFPLIAVSAAVTAAVLSADQMRHVENKAIAQFPTFVSDQLDLEGLVRNAGTVGVVGGVLLLFSGLGWVDNLRGSIRGIWRVEEDDGNFLAKKAKDLVILLGLGVVLVFSLGTSALATALMKDVAGWLGVADRGAGVALLRVAGICLAVGADFVLVVYLLRWLPGLHPRHRSLMQASLIAAVGFELLKLLLSGYLSDVAGKSFYGAFGTPVALLVWMNLMTRLLLLCASWTATAHEYRRPEDQATEGPDPREKGSEEDSGETGGKGSGEDSGEEEQAGEATPDRAPGPRRPAASPPPPVPQPARSPRGPQGSRAARSS